MTATVRKVWREGFAPLFSEEQLAALASALRRDDPRLVQGATVVPHLPSMYCDWPAEGACLVAYAGWQAEGLKTVDAVEAFFARMCFNADQRLGEAAACRHFLDWFDDTPRQQMRAELLAEVSRELARRGGSVEILAVAAVVPAVPVAV